MTALPDLRRFGALLVALGIVIALLVVASVFGDIQAYRHLWGGLRWEVVALILVLALLNHGVRYWRWERLTRRASGVDFRCARMLPVYAAGSVFIFTPARLGEAVKSVYARQYCGVSVSASLPVLLLERVGDVLVMALLAATGLLILGENANLLAGGLVLGAALLALWLWRPALRWLAGRNFIPPGWRQNLELVSVTAGASQRALLTPSSLGLNLCLGATAWILEVTIYYLSLVALGLSPAGSHYIFALAAFPLASLGGSVSFLPAGLGVTEGGLAALGLFLGGLPPETAVFAALLSRLAILGVVLLTGFAGMTWLSRLRRHDDESRAA